MSTSTAYQDGFPKGTFGKTVVADAIRQTRAFADYFRDHLRQECRPAYYATMFVFLAGLIAANYSGEVSLEDRAARYSGTYGVLLMFALYAVPFAFGIAAHAVFHRAWATVRDARFWLVALSAIALFAVYGRFEYHVGWVFAHVDAKHHAAVLRSTANLVPACFGMLGVAMIALAIRRRGETLGLGLRPVALKGYAVLFAILFPFILLAARQPDFLAAYPRAGAGPWPEVAIFEVCYGIDFVFTEIFFRGLLVIGLARWLGFGCVMPMVAFYMTIHFGKPLGEAIASVIGGWVLGVLAYRTRSIWGGVIFHLGVAYTLEAATWWNK